MSQNKKTVIFLNTVIVYDHNGKIEQQYKVGERVELTESSAERWIRRGKAEAAPDPEPKKRGRKPAIKTAINEPAKDAES